MEKINIFIDTNVLLSLYDVGSNNLTTFRDLLKLMEDKIQVLLPEQVKNEFYRNRENKLNTIFSNLPPIPNSFPNVIKDNENFHGIDQELRDLAILYQELIKNIKVSASEEQLLADQAIKEVFDKAKWLVVEDSIIKQAKRRYDIGNPPGKKASYGDAIIWETLLTKSKKRQDIFFVSSDNDYSSQLDRNKISSYLGTEWKNKINSDIYFFKNLDKLLKDRHFKEELDKRGRENSQEISVLLENIDLEIVYERNKNNLINNLKQSKSFEETHSLISSLSKLSDWTYSQRRDLAEALVNNNQVRSIISDADVFQFYANLNLMSPYILPEDWDIISEANDIIIEAKKGFGWS